MTNDRADAHIDDALEAVARPEPPREHLARVLARTGPENGHGLPAAGYLRPLWAVPIAASLLVAAGVTWTQRDVTLPPIVAGDADSAMDRLASGRSRAWGTPRELDRPALPPQAYWGMDAFEEWERLRPGTGHRVPGTGSWRSVKAAGNRGRDTRNARANPPQLAWEPVPSGLPPIELEPIASAPLAVVPLPEPSPIGLPAITLEPIVIAPLEEERP